MSLVLALPARATPTAPPGRSPSQPPSAPTAAQSLTPLELANVSSTRVVTDGSAYTPVANLRVLDTGRTYIPRYKEVRVRLGGFYGVPASGAGAAVVSLEVTASEAGRAFAWATGAARPGLPTSTFRPGSRSVHTVAIKLGKDGFVSIAANVPARMRLAVIGWTPESAGVTPTTSTRLVDGRSTGWTVDGRYQGAGPTAAGTTLTVQVRSRGGIPSTASWVLASVTAFTPSRAGTAWIWPGGTRPAAPLLAWGTGRTTTSLVMVPLSASGTLALSVSSSATVAVEVVGYGVRGPGVAAVRPAQLLTSAATSRTVDRQQEGVGPLVPGSVFRVRVLGRGGVPSSGVKAVVLDVRASGATNPGGLAAYAPGGATSTIAQGATNPSVTTSNLMVVPLGSDGTIALTSTVKTMVAVTVEGFVRKGSLTDSYVDVPATTRFVQPGDLASAVAADETSGLVSYSLKPEADSIAVGHLVVLSPSPGAPSGHVGRVVSVSGGATQDQVVMTPARLEEAVPSANVAYAGPLGAFQTSPLAQTAPYRQVQTLVAADAPGDTAIGISCDGHLSSLSAKLALKLYVDMHFSWGGDTRESTLIVTFKLDGGASISLQPGGSCTFEGPVLARWTQPVGPVALNFAMRPYAELGGQLDLAAASYVIDSAMTVGFRTVDGALEPVNDLQSNNRAEGLKALAAGSVSLELGLKLEALAYGLVGVNIKAGPYVEAAVTRSGWQLSCDLSAAFRVSASAALDLWMLTKLEAELASGIFARKSLGSIGCGEVPPPAVITGRLPQAMVGVGYYTPLESSGGVQPNTYTAGGLPPGIVVSGSTLVGEPTTTGSSFSVDIAVTDGAGRTASRTLTLVVTQPPETIAPLLGKIAQLPDGTSAYIDLRGGRHRIPDGGTFQCINAQGKAVVTTDSATFNALPPYEDAACVRANTGDIVNVGGAAYEIDGTWTTHHIANAMTYLCRAANGHRAYGQVPRYWLLDLAAGAELYDACWVPSNAPRKVVRWSDGSSTYIDSRQRSHSIPDGGTYECLVAQSADYGVVVPAIYRPPSDPENARCIKANVKDLVAYGPVSYLIGSGYELRSVVDGISYECLAANGSPVFGQVPRYWVDDRAEGDPATYHCWDKSLALGHVVRFSNGESWYVDLRGGRHHVPDGGTYECIKAQRGDYGVVVPEGRLAEMPKYEPAECVRANQGDLVQFGQDAYLVDTGFVRRRIPDGVSFDCLAANGHAVYGQVPRYWLLDLTEGAEAPFHCWNSSAARGHTVRVVDRSSFYVDKRGGRHWVPDGGTYQCIDAQVGSYPYVVPTYSIQELPQYENAQCVRATPGNIIRHNDGDAYILNGDWTRSHIPTPSSFTCFQVEGRALVNGVPRYYVDDLVRTANDAVYPSGHCIIRRPNGTSYFVNNEARKEWIPDTPTWDCEVGRGVPVINAGDAIIDAVAETGWHYCLNKAQLRGKVLRHIDGHDAHYIHGDDTRTWIPDEFTFNCRTWAGTAVAETRWREYITAFRDTGWDYCYNLNTFKNRHIIHPDGDRHFVGGDGRRHWIPANRLDCMNARHGAPATVRWRQYINNIAEGEWAVCGNVLYRNQLMDRGQFLASSNGRYRLWMQTDGNLVLYNSAGTAIWATNRIGRHLKLHDDGCLAEVDYNGNWVWRTSCNGGGDRLVVQDDGNLVLYAGATAVWATNTVGR